MRRRIGLLFAVPVLAVLATAAGACGGESDGNTGVPSVSGGTAAPSASPSGASGEYQQQLAFSQCMRENGLPDYPDPDPNGQANLGNSTIDRNSTAFKNAYEACQDKLPSGGEKPQANTEQLAQMTQYAKCIRDNGVPDFPDPGPDGFDPGSFPTDDPAFQQAQEACQQFLTWR